MKIALMKGNRMNPWHCAVFKPVARVHDVTAFVLSGNLFELDEIPFKMERIFWKNEVGPWASRKLENLKYRLLHPRTGYQIPMAPIDRGLESYDLIQTWELHTEWSLEAARAKKRSGAAVLVLVWQTIPFVGHGQPGRDEVIKCADRFLVYTERSETALVLEGIPRKAIRRLKPGVDLARFHPGVRADFTLPGCPDDSGRPVVLFAGRLVPSKGIDYLLYAFRLVLDERPKERPLLLLVGRGPQRAGLQALAKQLSISQDVVFADPIPYRDIAGLYRRASVLVLPSLPTPQWQEQFGMVLLEAMASGIPVISTLSGAIPEIVGPAGLLVAPADVVELACALKKVLHDKAWRDECTAAGRERVERNFDAEANGELFLQVYGEFE